jgi:pimeloyl-ACP methyl ester carboxylesterase
MGGLIGVTLAGGRLKGRITHLVINDIGPEVAREGVDRIASYVGNPPVFDRVSELEAWFRRNYAPFGDNTDAFWRRMADTSVRRTDDGRITVHYDPKIVMQLTRQGADRDLWDEYDAITARTLILRGERSDVLSERVAEEMRRRGPKPQLQVVRDCGHAPTLATPAQIALLRDFLRS